ncbi:hypothetical protein MASR2M18_14950 [Ignavibacteria bacterium]|nr:SusD/RagB family nutrient-binding outer membrane lipoprotein [Bacteroidota bacterium]MCZ2132948.1 SusD/RagB family nutrient-binding outer membrane lipoprotein [Bacteroidota bacterium]
MKKYLLSGIAAVILLSSCDQWIDTSINNDPNNVSNVSLNVILPTSQAGLGYVVGGDLGRFSGLLTQHLYGAARQSQGMYGYIITESDIDNAWQYNLYAGPMQDFHDMAKTAKEKESPYYQGVAEILMAYSLGSVVDLWDSAPYSDAFKGNANLKPTFDNGEQLYAEIHKLLDNAIANLGAASSVYSPGADDFIYGGDKAKWIKAAHAFKARCYMHTRKKDPSATAKVLSECAAAFTSNGDDMQFVFGTKESEANPLYQFDVQRNDIRMGPKLMEIMNATNDPRRPMYALLDDDTLYSNNSGLGPYYASINSPVPFITYAEVKFLEAEAALISGDKAKAVVSYNEAIAASMEKLGVDAADAGKYTAQANVATDEGNITLERIMEQKYIAMFTQFESWADWRRTGFPVLTPTNGPQIPRRFPYPQSERIYNGANWAKVNPGNVPISIFSRVWWDVE